MRKFFIISILAAASFSCAFAAEPENLGAFFYDNAFSYNVIDESEHTCQVSGWRYTYADHGVMTIPESATYKNVTYTVVKIGENAFTTPAPKTHEVSKVIMPNSIIEIGDNAFRSNRTITSSENSFQFYDVKDIVWSSNLKTIGNNVFMGNNNYTKINLPDSLEQVGDSCFLSYGLEVESPKSNNQTPNIYYPLKTLHLGKNLKHLGINAFGNARYSNVSLSENNISLSIDSISGSCTSIPYTYRTYILYDFDKEKIITTFSDKTNAAIYTPEVIYGHIAPSEITLEFKVPESVKTICDYAFRPNCGFGRIFIGENVETLGSLSITGVAKNGQVIIDRLTPPEIQSGQTVFMPTDGDSYKLMIYVPLAAVDLYKITPGYNDPRYVLVYPMESIGMKSAATGIGEIYKGEYTSISSPLYNAEGVMLSPNADRDFVESLSPGLYIWNGKKIIR